MTAEPLSFRLLVCLTCMSLLDACSLLPTSADSPAPAYRRQMLQSGREKNLQSVWRGKSYNALLDNFGMPKYLMNVPGQRQLPTSVAVYGVTDNLSQCIDAFTLVVLHSGDVIISDYFCR